MSDQHSAPLRWVELAAKPRDPNADPGLVVEALIACGGRAVEECGEGWLRTHVPLADGKSAPDSMNVAHLAEMTGVELDLHVRRVPSEDWAREWRKGLGIRRVGDRVVVRPSWEAYDANPDDVVISLDPGVAFGTAEHATTRGCLRLLERVVCAGDRVLDIGSGSGILAIAAVMLGASEAVAVEGDELACNALPGNLRANNVEGRVHLVQRTVEANDLVGLGPADGLVANIEEGPISSLLPGFGPALVPAGWLIVSGIPEPRWTSVARSVELAGFSGVATDSEEGWVSGLFRKPRG